jgi:hypothetical protein
VFVAIHRRSQRLLACKVTDISQGDLKVKPLSITGSQDQDWSSSKEVSRVLMERQRKLREVEILKDLDHVRRTKLQHIS